ncbi:zinc metalloprotease [Streptomyces sp. WM4235]|uniref:M1 family metallopeptidase n=1 Tax=unclassified Streptomyces TaxID=2593676 RepID=UPI0006AF67EC|nr:MULTISPECIES: M1 family metallopeptidase [unclassified Streptomyces]KOU37664.1 zinc metalloprotease [Streptomyces sp. WM4235]MCX5072978.1 M1 family metallopeptidase [Streptomyces sp. NBC_00424]WUD43727.1 M1 family metallopeptidase [Streptomyces sp. NBC_00513]
MQLTSPRLRAALLAAASLTLVAAVLPPPQSLGIGDRLFPELGNPGYDVLSYDLSFTYKDNRTPLDAVTVISARTLHALDRINLDFTHGQVASVEVNGEPARFESAGEDLVLTPARPVTQGSVLSITVRHTSDPRGRGDGGWVPTEDGLAMANQADAAHRVFPCNDHPADKAYFTFRITAPAGLTAVANGLPGALPTRRAGGPTTWTYRTLHPMATELAQVSVGTSEVVHHTGPHGLPLRDVVPAADRVRLEPWLKKTDGHVRWMEERVGRYPFENYGVLIARATTGFELETQTLSLFEHGLFSGNAGYPEWYVESVMVHELAHQWFGDSVSPRTWSDLWLNEGHATWYEALYADGLGKYSLERRMREAYQRSDQWRAAGGPPAAPKAAAPGEKIGLFRPVVYDGAALILYALRQEVGVATFDRIERRWVDEHADSTAGTDDFVRLASQEAGRDLTAFLKPWLYGTTTPAMPGHPEWGGPKSV